ncbi:general substrate transporter [Aspergillus pseudonomiae]|uniref:General substrate transporter n=1 Tax=Aspergillus pseudonomiae TaxID=1506151 RepID=A0A5N7D172_9EURO|nr:general substrate transporter [Aspergillus pseudonomiae]KAE8400124.1 general substrate transporter [Aspergillus pseudonomiae]
MAHSTDITMPSTTPKYTWTIFMVMIFGSLSSAGFGFDQAWWSAIMSLDQFLQTFGSYDQSQEKWVLSSRDQSIGTGMGYVGVILGVICGTPLNERFGRKMTLYIQSFVVAVGVIIESTCTTSYAQFVVGKAVVYFGGGIATNAIPTYQGECAPPSLRGLMAGTYNAFLMIGGLAAALIVYLCRHITTDWAWRVVVVAQIGIPAVGWISLPFLPESPHWLIRRGRLDEATSALRRLRGPEYPAAEEVIILQQTLEEERELREAASWKDCFSNAVNLRRTVICIGVQVFQQAQGISFVANYQAVFLSQIGFREVLLMSVIVYVIGVVANLLSMVTSDRSGRRGVLLGGAALLGACMMVIGGLTTGGPSHMSYSMQIAAVVMLMLWFFCFQTTWGPLAWVITSEVPPTSVREKMVTLSGFSAYGVGLIIVFVNPYTQDAIGGSVAFIYGSLSVVGFLFVFFFVPELRQRSLEQIDEMFNEQLPTRGFASYACKRPSEGRAEKEIETVEYVETLP